jgi:hypothetical protein
MDAGNSTMRWNKTENQIEKILQTVPTPVSPSEMPNAELEISLSIRLID